MFIIAEAGTSHSGSLEKGFTLIEKAAESGADCVKFQVVFADEILHPLCGRVKLPGGNTGLYEKFKELERDEEFFLKLKQETEKCGIKFLATPFGIKSARLLKNIGVSMLKIASPELNHYPLLEEVTGYKLPLIISGGVSMLSDIEKAVAITGRDITFLHCVTSYPAPEEDYNLALIKTLSAVFGFKTGVSDHSADPLLVPLVSMALGAVTLEKHITLDKSGGGLDDATSLNPHDFKKMSGEIRQYQKSCKIRPDRKVLLAELQRRFGKEKVRAVTGDGVKKLASSEKDNYGRTNRSLMALRTIMPGEKLKEMDFAPLRSEKNLTPGLSPDFAELITGKTVRNKIKNGEGIRFDSFFMEN
ncbi:MAG: N-acetylneuraminate synthase family protein [Spirochaetia bacterium]|jgi:N-acetylneuraminate synthase|nr:N-acetylneuraminate synthase family protein [Spirochaetia bacterium]